MKNINKEIIKKMAEEECKEAIEQARLQKGAKGEKLTLEEINKIIMEIKERYNL